MAISDWAFYILLALVFCHCCHAQFPCGLDWREGRHRSALCDGGCGFDLRDDKPRPMKAPRTATKAPLKSYTLIAPKDGPRRASALMELEAPDCSQALFRAQELARLGHTVVIVEGERAIARVESASTATS